MPIIKWDPFDNIEKFFGGTTPFSRTPVLGWDLAVDVYEKDGNVVVEMSLPGIDSERIDISVEEKSITLAGSREEEKEQKDKHYYSKEIRRGSFQRTISLPSSVQTDKAVAEYNEGVLKVTIPKQTVAQGKVKVKVKKYKNY